MKQLLPFIFLCLGVFVISCKDDDSNDPEPLPDCTNIDPSYMNDIKPIVEATCAIAGCHVTNFNFGDFTTYEDLKAKADSGLLRERAVVDKDMPPDNTLGPTELTNAQIQLIHCWIADGAPNN